eukprot:NODE_285_length_11794_cov_0.197178.p9 type:complete len:108 gc:universal NODE_285_length_11794_cov_0.197178:7630-7953(+)
MFTLCHRNQQTKYFGQVVVQMRVFTFFYIFERTIYKVKRQESYLLLQTCPFTSVVVIFLCIYHSWLLICKFSFNAVVRTFSFSVYGAVLVHIFNEGLCILLLLVLVV